jgi:hypothetical protein
MLQILERVGQWHIDISKATFPISEGISHYKTSPAALR